MSPAPLRQLLACPACGSRVEVNRESIQCVGCRLAYPMLRGIPRFADSSPELRNRGTAKAFGFEFTRLDPLNGPVAKTREDVITFFRATGLDAVIYHHVSNSAPRTDLSPESVKYDPDGGLLLGATVLDAGSGAGRFTKLLASYGAHVVALELSESVERTARETASLPNVLVVQGDILSPPLQAASFDFVFSIGVLHHTADTRRGLMALANLVKPGGVLSVWVYAHDYWGGPVKKAVTQTIRLVLLRLPIRWQAAFCERILLPVGRLQMWLARRRVTKWLAAPLFILNIPRYPDRQVMLSTIFDYWAAPVIRTHRSEELYDWFAQLGFEDIRILPTPTAVRGRRPN